jgi:hypothetical protein
MYGSVEVQLHPLCNKQVRVTSAPPFISFACVLTILLHQIIIPVPTASFINKFHTSISICIKEPANVLTVAFTLFQWCPAEFYTNTCKYFSYL